MHKPVVRGLTASDVVEPGEGITDQLRNTSMILSQLQAKRRSHRGEETSLTVVQTALNVNLALPLPLDHEASRRREAFMFLTHPLEFEEPKSRCVVDHISEAQKVKSFAINRPNTIRRAACSRGSVSGCL